MIQEEMSIFWAVILKKKIHMNMWLNLNGYRDTVFLIYKYKSIVNFNKEGGIIYS